jgi:lipoprotein-releasing system ATP-binding protein
MSSVLELRGITRHYAQGANEPLRVLNGVDLAIQPGELVALVGPSGSGKSTLLQVAGLLDSPQSGEILIGGEAAQQANDRKRTALRNKYIGFIYQFHHLLPELTAEENAAMPLLLAGVSRSDSLARARALLARLNMSPRAHHLPSQLSGGEQQRVAIARALANRPKLILGDEPTGNLDPTTSDNVTALLLEVVKEEGAAALIATHSMKLASRLSRAITLRDGQVIPAEVYS